jgi:23S rRNA (uracil1939-C5)-methyltransferase
MAYKRSHNRRSARLAKEGAAAAAMPTVTLSIESIDLEGNGIAHDAGGKVVFVSGAVTGECVQAQLTKSKTTYDKARVVQVLKPSSQRVEPVCPHFGVCGGCTLQHVQVGTQVAIKQRVLEDQLAHISKLKAETILPPVAGLSWGYRYRARLSVKDVVKKNTVLVGFHERASTYVADIRSCAVLPPHVSALLMPLRELVASLSVRAQLPQIEVAVGEVDTALLMRHLAPLTPQDVARMDAFAAQHSAANHALVWFTQATGPDSIAPLHAHTAGNLHYALPAYGITMPFKVSDFTQVNHPMNRVLVSKAIGLLGVQAGERILDLFCGLGNFTLPLARVVGEQGFVMGIEGSTALTQRAQANAVHNDLNNTAFEARNLFAVSAEDMYAWGHALAFDRWLIDPPREGAQAVCEALLRLPRSHRPKRMVYVSCNPATLARDAGILCHSGHWTLSKAGIANMFPHTSHVESIAVFERV